MRAASPQAMSVVLVDRTRVEPGDYLAPITGACLKTWAYRDAELKSGVRVHIIHGDGEGLDELARRVLEAEPHLVGFSCYVWNMDAVRGLAAALRARRPRLKIILGGPEVGPIPERSLASCPAADYVCLDEGEETFRLLLRHLALRDRTLEEVPGLAYRRADGSVVRTQAPELIDVAQTVSPYLTGEVAPEPGGDAVVELSRGCPFTCKFCDWRLGKMRYIPLPRVFEEFKLFAAREVRHVVLADADIFMNRRRGLDIIRGFLDSSRGASTVLTLDTNPTFLCEEVIDLLAGASERFILRLGLQSVNESVLKLSQRELDLDRVERNVALLQAKTPSLRYMFSIIFGLPGDDLAGYKRTLDWICAKRPTALILSQFLMLPGAAFYAEAGSLGAKFQQESPHQVLETPTMSAADIRAARELSYGADLLFLIPTLRDAVLATLPPDAPAGAHVRLIEDWMAFVQARGIDLFLGMPVGRSDDRHVHSRVVLALDKLKADPGHLAALHLATSQFCLEAPRPERAAPRKVPSQA